MKKEQMNIVVVGHVDHGKSTLIGRLLADTNSLPEGKLEQVREKCRKESRTFEYAYLLDALKDEQQQGITIDSARCFFKSSKRDYIIIDAPGHIEFLKNMISGASRAEAALLLIDAAQGVQENSRRHAFMLSLLGIKQVVVCVNKMDLVNYDRRVFEAIKEDFASFLEKIGIVPREFIPVSSIEGENIIRRSEKLSWFTGSTKLEALDGFSKEPEREDAHFRMPVQDVYRFSEDNDARRIVVGRIESGSIRIGDEVKFYPSGKVSRIKSIETFGGKNKHGAVAGYCEGFTLEEQIYVTRGEIMHKKMEQGPETGSRIRANIFWMGKRPLEEGKRYFFKIHTKKVPVRIEKVGTVLDASTLGGSSRDCINRHEVGECILETSSPISFDVFHELQHTGRFVLVEDYDVVGGGIVLERLEDDFSEIRKKILERNERWYEGIISPERRSKVYGNKPAMVFLTGKTGVDKMTTAKHLERKLFEQGQKTYFLGIGNILRGLDADIDKEDKREHLRRLGELCHILLDAGLLLFVTASDLGSSEFRYFREILGPRNLFFVEVGEAGEEKSSGADLYLLEDDDSKAEKIEKFLRERRIF